MAKRMKKILFILLIGNVTFSFHDSKNSNHGLYDEVSICLNQSDSIKIKTSDDIRQEQFNLGFQRAHYLNNNLVKKNLKLSNDEFWRLVAEVYYTVNEQGISTKPISTHFESVSFLPEKNYRNIYRFRENLMKTFSVYRLEPHKYKNRFRNNFFVPSDTVRIPNSDRFIVPMHGYGFESIPYIFSIFTIVDDNYYFNGIMDSCFSVSIGTIVIKEIISLQNGVNIMIGESGGGDAGEEWCSLWFASFDNEYKIEVHKSFGFGYGYGEDQNKIEYSLNTKSKEVYVYNFERSVVTKISEHFKYTDWVQTKCDTVNLRKLTKNIENAK